MKFFLFKANETHYVTHLQYLAWPDQGVPDDDADFLKLIFRLRALRFDKPDANVIVHCRYLMIYLNFSENVENFI